MGGLRQSLLEKSTNAGFLRSPFVSSSHLSFSLITDKHTEGNFFLFAESSCCVCAGGKSPSSCLQQILSAASRLANIMMAMFVFAASVCSHVSRFYVLIFYLLNRLIEMLHVAPIKT